MTPYATTGDLTAWTGAAAPSNSANLLRSATLLVAVATGRDPYLDVPTGTDAAILRDATTAQAAAWSAAGINPAAGGLDAGTVKETKLGSGGITYDVAAQAEARAAAVARLSAEARSILYSGGLLLVDLPVGADECDGLVDYFGTGIVTGRRISFSAWRNL